MKTSTTPELKQVLLELNRGVQEVLNKEEITTRIAFLQTNRKRIAGSAYYGNMNHSFKDNGKWSNGKVCTKPHKDYNPKLKEQYDNDYYEIRSLKCKLKLMDMQA